MGFTISTIKSIENSSFLKYAFILGNTEILDKNAKIFLENFNVLGKSIGKEAVIVKGYDQELTNEICHILEQSEYKNDSKKVMNSYDDMDCYLMICNNNPNNFNEYDEYVLINLNDIGNSYDKVSQFEKNFINYMKNRSDKFETYLLQQGIWKVVKFLGAILISVV